MVMLGCLPACSGAPGAAAARVEDDVHATTPPARAVEPSEAEAPMTAEPPVRVLANLGDSISQAFDADDASPPDLRSLFGDPSSVFHDNPSLSWVQGTDPRVPSVALHHKARFPGLVLVPRSRAGAELVNIHRGLPNLELQAKSLAEASARPDLVYVLLGGNDVCNRTPAPAHRPAVEALYAVDALREAARRGLDALATVLQPAATVRFVSMPRVDQLYDVVGDAKVEATLTSGLLVETTCRGLWDAAHGAIEGGICPVVTREASAARRAELGARIDAYNDVLAAEVRAMNGDARRNPKRVSFESDWQGAIGRGGVVGGSGGTLPVTAEQVSKIDCFHPNVAGQAAIAEMVLKRAAFTR